MWSWANDGTVDISTVNWSPSKEYDDELWETLGENNASMALADLEELQRHTWTNNGKKLRCRGPSFSSKMSQTLTSEIEKLSRPESKLMIMEGSSSAINDSQIQPSVVVDMLEIASVQTEDWNAFPLVDEDVHTQTQTRDGVYQPVSQEVLCTFNVPCGKDVVEVTDTVKSGMDESSLTSLYRLPLPDIGLSQVEKKLFEAEDDSIKLETVKKYEWEQIRILDSDMENFLDDSFAGESITSKESVTSKSYPLQWSSPGLFESTPSNVAVPDTQTCKTSVGVTQSELVNGQLNVNEIATTTCSSVGPLQKKPGSFRHRFLLNCANSSSSQLIQLPTLRTELFQQNYLENQLNARDYLNATIVPQSNGLTRDATHRMANTKNAQETQTSSLSDSNKAQILGGQSAKHPRSEPKLNNEFTPRNIQFLSLADTPQPADFTSLQHSLSVQQSPHCPQPSPLSSLPLSNTGLSPHAFLQGTAQLPQQSPNQFISQLPLLSSPSKMQAMQLLQAHVDLYQYTPTLDKQQQNQQLYGMPDNPSRPLVSGTNMTPQEKMEKLRWRQQIQAKLAVEEKKNQLSNPHMDYESSNIQHPTQTTLCVKQQTQHPLMVNLEKGAARPPAAPFLSQSSNIIMHNHKETDGKESISNKNINVKEKTNHLDAEPLRQLECIIMQLDVKTRLLIRDALYRLASSTVHRNAGKDTPSAQKDHSSHTRRYDGACTMETSTNLIDRTIANLLFNKQPIFSTKKQVYLASPNGGNLLFSPSTQGHLWALQTLGP